MEALTRPLWREQRDLASIAIAAKFASRPSGSGSMFRRFPRMR
jgi:hypothetical protein